MLKRTLLIFALVAIVIGTLVAQTPRVEARGRFRMDRDRSTANFQRGERQHHNMPQMKNRGVGRGNRGQAKPARLILSMSEELELTDRQVTKITGIQTDFTKAQNLKQAQVKNLQLDKREAMKQRNFKSANTATKAMYKLKEEMALARIKAVEDIHKELTSEQTAILDAQCRANRE